MNLEMQMPRVDFDEIQVTEAIAEQVKSLCKQTENLSPWGMKIVTCKYLPENGYVLLRGGKVVGAGVFKNVT
jgi:hypothetical protein